MNKFTIVLSLDNDDFSNHFQDAIEKNLEDFPFEVIVHKSATKTLDFLSEHEAHLIIFDERPIGLELNYFLTEIQNINGAMGLIMLYRNEYIEKENDHVEYFSFPIFNWTDFLLSVRAFIPEELKLKYAIKRPVSDVYSEVIQYALEIKQNWEKESHEFSKDHSNLFLPKHLIQKGNFSSTHKNQDVKDQSLGFEDCTEYGGPKDSHAIDSHSNFDLLNHHKQLHTIVIEIFISAIIFILSYLVLNSERFETDSWLSLRGLMIGLSSVTLFSIFVSNVFRGFIFYAKRNPN